MADTDLARRIRRAREAKRLHGQPWTQAYLASLVGVNVRTVSRWETGEAEPRGSIGALEQVLGVSLAEDADPGELELREKLAWFHEKSLMNDDDVAAYVERYKRRRAGRVRERSA